MVAHILVAYDESEQAQAALEFALEEHPAARVTALRVINPTDVEFSTSAAFPDFPEEWFQNEKERAGAELERAESTADEYEVELDTAVEVGKPATTIVEYADDHAVDLIVIGSHGRTGVSRIILGSVAEGVMRRAAVPVTVVR